MMELVTTMNCSGGKINSIISGNHRVSVRRMLVKTDGEMTQRQKL